MSEEQRAKLSAARKGFKLSEETKAKLRKPWSQRRRDAQNARSKEN